MTSGVAVRGRLVWYVPECGAYHVPPDGELDVNLPWACPDGFKPGWHEQETR